MDLSAESSAIRSLYQEAILLMTFGSPAYRGDGSPNNQRLLIMCVPFQVCTPSRGGLFDGSQILPGYRKISQVTDGRIMKKPACREFFIVKLIGIS